MELWDVGCGAEEKPLCQEKFEERCDKVAIGEETRRTRLPGVVSSRQHSLGQAFANTANPHVSFKFPARSCRANLIDALISWKCVVEKGILWQS